MISEDWATAIEQTKEPMWELFQLNIDHLTTRKIYLDKHRRKHKWVKSLVYVEGEMHPYTPLLPRITEFIENVYNISLAGDMNLEVELYNNHPLYIIICQLYDLNNILSGYNFSSDAPLLLTQENAREIKELVVALYSKMAGTVTEDDYTDANNLLDSDFIEYEEFEA